MLTNQMKIELGRKAIESIVDTLAQYTDDLIAHEDVPVKVKCVRWADLTDAEKDEVVRVMKRPMTEISVWLYAVARDRLLSEEE